MINKEITLEGIIINQLHHTTEKKSDITLKTENNEEYSFMVLLFNAHRDHTALNKDRRIRIKALIDDNTNEIIKIKELWSKVELREY